MLLHIILDNKILLGCAASSKKRNCLQTTDNSLVVYNSISVNIIFAYRSASLPLSVAN